MSNLVATAAERKSLGDGNVGVGDALGTLKIIGPGIALGKGLYEVDPLNAFGGGISLGADIASLAADPIASLAGSVASFLLTHMKPLQDMLDVIAGNPLAVAAQAATWNNVADRVSTTSDGLRSSVSSALAGWTGLTADAYQVFTGIFAEVIEGLSTICRGIGAALAGASAIVDFVRSIVKDIISDLVGKLISWAIQVAATACVGAAWVLPEAIVAISVRVAKVGDWLNQLRAAVTRLAKKASELTSILDQTHPRFESMKDSLKAVPATHEPLKMSLDYNVKSTTSAVQQVLLKKVRPDIKNEIKYANKAEKSHDNANAAVDDASTAVKGDSSDD